MNTTTDKQIIESQHYLGDIMNGNLMRKLHERVRQLVTKMSLEEEKLTESQFVEAIKQAILAGDFVKFVTPSGGSTVVYIPYNECERLRGMLNQILDAVKTCYDGESRFETALRYVVERESRDSNTPACNE